MHLQATTVGEVQAQFSINTARCAGTACAGASLIDDAAAGFCATTAAKHADNQSPESTLSS